MSKGNGYFERITVERVKKIATEFHAEGSNGADGVPRDGESRKEAVLHAEQWRELAQRVQHEQDSGKMIGLVEQLIDSFDREELRRRQARSGNA